MSKLFGEVMPILPEDRLITQMIIPVSKETFFNTKWQPATKPLSAYDMLFHPPDYNPKATRSDRQEPEIIRHNIWEQEAKKGIPSTTHLRLGRPKWKPFDLPTKEFVRVVVKTENPHMHVYDVLEWAEIQKEGREALCHR